MDGRAAMLSEGRAPESLSGRTFDERACSLSGPALFVELPGHAGAAQGNVHSLVQIQRPNGMLRFLGVCDTISLPDGKMCPPPGRVRLYRAPLGAILATIRVSKRSNGVPSGAPDKCLVQQRDGPGTGCGSGLWDALRPCLGRTDRL